MPGFHPAPLGANALAVLGARYLARDPDGHIVETPEAMFRRVSGAVAEAERGYGASDTEVAAVAEAFYRRMAACELLPNSPALMNAGRPLGQLAACFVVPVADSTEAIFDAVKWAALIQKTGGGTGFSFSRLRPAGDRVESTGNAASGPIPFLRAFDAATQAIRQGGMRRGANMGVLRVDHPDVLDFITLKLARGEMSNFNLSVAVTDAFMAAVDAGGDYALLHPRTGRELRRLPARRVFELVVRAAWQCGDPGVLFIDRINADNPTPALGLIEATNPCGEQPLLPFESCVLASVNLARFTAAGDVDWRRLGPAIRDGVRLLDDIIDVSRYPLPAIAEATRATRKLGLGVMGFADLLIALGVPYDSEPALELAGAIAGFLEREAVAASEQLAAERGAFPRFAASRWAGRDRAVRNATMTTVAPTGTLSIIAGCSSGIEPLYAVAYERHVLDGATLRELHAGFEAEVRRRGVWTERLRDLILARGSVRGLRDVPEDMQRVFVTAHDVAPEHHVRMQAAFQRHCHAAVSKTVNLPTIATPDDVAACYRLAHRLGCKGVTVYRDGSHPEQVLARGGARPASSIDHSCPECGAGLRRAGRCRACPACGWSVCG
jgi:ribonucleoside-diphosphate reductase alpha chain